MKGFIAALITFAVLCALVFTNGWAVGRALTELEQMCANLPESPEEAHGACIELAEKWDSSAVLLELSVNRHEVELIKSKITLLESYCLSGDAAEYRASAASLQDSLGDLRRSEGLSFSGIF